MGRVDEGKQWAATKRTEQHSIHLQQKVSFREQASVSLSDSMERYKYLIIGLN